MLSTPSITPAQIKAVIVQVTTLSALLGLNVGDDVSNSVTIAVVALFTAYSSVVVAADAVIRRARANNAVAIAQSQALQVQNAPVGPSSVGG